MDRHTDGRVEGATADGTGASGVEPEPYEALVAAGERAADLDADAAGATRWFVYDNQAYYPSATIIEADTAEAARDTYKTRTFSTGFHGIAVFPLSALALWECGVTDAPSIEDTL